MGVLFENRRWKGTYTAASESKAQRFPRPDVSNMTKYVPQHQDAPNAPSVHTVPPAQAVIPFALDPHIQTFLTQLPPMNLPLDVAYVISVLQKLPPLEGHSVKDPTLPPERESGRMKRKADEDSDDESSAKKARTERPQQTDIYRQRQQRKMGQ
eukprot:c15004_g1_i1.p1 GENE.c15004_g1_i1~~c15004_g1_i1.p1  ORF type:complete len:154 (+),score=25.89 c15004_g1_i1:1-462(+)